MQRLQLREDLSDRCFRRLLRLELAYSLSMSFHAYMLMRSYGEFSTSEPAPINDAEQFVDMLNQWCAQSSQFLTIMILSERALT